MKYALLIFAMALCTMSNLYSQTKIESKGIFEDPKEGFYEEILKQLDDYTPSKDKKKIFRVDFNGLDIPKSLSEFKTYWYNPPISQGRTGTCWCFSTTSYFESEINRLYGKKVKLSEMYTVYFEYLEKAKRFVSERGNSAIGEGSEANAVSRIWKKYGIVPEDAYTGLQPGQKFHDHKKLFDEINAYLQNLKTTNAWDEETAVQTVKSILNHYLGVPPVECTVDGKKYTPQEYFHNYLKIDVDNYVDILSLKEKPYYQQVEYEVPDNWWHDSSYYNIPLDEYMSLLKQAVTSGYTSVIGGDVSEAGYSGCYNAAIIPTFDIPSEYINEDARQFRFSNATTTDDHGIHAVGYKEKDGKFWFLIKDSGSGSRNGKVSGYYFYHEDYVKLKIMDFMIPKDAAKSILSKFSK